MRRTCSIPQRTSGFYDVHERGATRNFRQKCTIKIESEIDKLYLRVALNFIESGNKEMPTEINENKRF